MSQRVRRRRLRATTIAATAFVVLGCAGFGVFQYGLPWWSGPGDRHHVFVAADGSRQHYQVHVPAHHDVSAELPVMMAIHGCGMSGFGVNSMKAATRFNALADREGFIVVYPTQRPFQSRINCWNSGDPRNQLRGAGEPALLAGVAREVVDTYGADPERVHVAGASSGAGTAVILGVTYPDVFATVTSVAGGEYGLNQVDPDDPEATPPTATARQAWAQMGDRARHVPLLIVQGGQDTVVAPLVGERLERQWTALNDLIDDGLLNASLQLRTEAVSHQGFGERYDYATTTMSTPGGRVVVETIDVPELGHTWPGPYGEGLFTDPSGPDASAAAWDFARRHDVDAEVYGE